MTTLELAKLTYDSYCKTKGYHSATPYEELAISDPQEYALWMRTAFDVETEFTFSLIAHLKERAVINSKSAGEWGVGTHSCDAHAAASNEDLVIIDWLERGRQ